MSRPVFFVSDGTGITAEALGRSLLSQFELIEFEQHTLPYIDSRDKAQSAVEDINHTAGDARGIIFSTLIDPDLRQLFQQCDALFIDCFGIFINPLAKELNAKPSKRIGRSHGLVDPDIYDSRIDAVNFAMATDDGTNTKHYDNADLILVGVSRCGKTPTSLYLALNHGIYVSNYPFTDLDFNDTKLPSDLQKYKHKLYGLTIDSMRLHTIREQRRPNSSYASRRQCQVELNSIEMLYRKENIPFIDSTRFSIEEIAAKILTDKNLKRRL